MVTNVDIIAQALKRKFQHVVANQSPESSPDHHFGMSSIKRSPSSPCNSPSDEYWYDERDRDWLGGKQKEKEKENAALSPYNYKRNNNSNTNSTNMRSPLRPLNQ